MNIWDRPLFVGKTDGYSITLGDKWLDGETIISANVTSVDSPDNITLGVHAVVTGNTVSVPITGVTEGYHTVHFEYDTATRSSCCSVIVHVDSDC